MRDSTWVNLLISIWLIVAAFFLVPPSITRAWNEIIVGSVLMIVAGWAMTDPRSAMAVSLEVSIGAWLIVSPLVLSYRATPGMWNQIICGIVTVTVAVTAWYGVRHPARTA